MTRRLPGRSSHFTNSSVSFPTIAKVVRHRDISEFALLVRKKLCQPLQITDVPFRYRLHSFLRTRFALFFKNFPDFLNVQTVLKRIHEFLVTELFNLVTANNGEAL